jgi:tetratricopeptide (TPR) repeat protein
MQYNLQARHRSLKTPVRLSVLPFPFTVQMKDRSPKAYAPLAAVALCLLLAGGAFAHKAEDEWTSVQSRNFLLVGDASERDMRKVAARLEQFREAFLRLLPVEHFDSSIPLTVVVFRDDKAYRPFEPLFSGQLTGVAGFFQSNADVDYITLSVDRQHVRRPDALAFHEYVHLLVRNSFGKAPLWFNEGLAEYYSTFEISDGNKKVTLGKPVTVRVRALVEREFIPLESLLNVDENSPYYKEQAKRSIFYAESWALVHYLLSKGRRAELSTYLGLLAKGLKVEDAFHAAFQTDFATLENELREYIRLNNYPRQVITFDKRLELDEEMQSTPLKEAEAQFYLGDLLLHTNRLDEALTYLQRAVTLDPNFARAYASLGVLHMRQNRFNDAKKHLERASRDSDNYLVHYYYAYVLSREGIGSDNFVKGYYETETAELMRAELKKAIELAPKFAEAYRLLAFVNLVRDEQLDESIALLKQAMALSPRRQEFALLLAQVYLRREEFDVARKVLDPLAGNSANSQVRAQAQSLLDAVASREAYVARVKAINDKLAADTIKENAPPGVLQPCDVPYPGPQLKKRRFAGEQVCGMLVRVECDEEGVVLVVEAGERTLRLYKDSLNHIRFVTYTVDVRGQVMCGQRAPANPVLVTYRQAKGQRAQTDGEVIAVEFVPKEWNANH